MDITSASFSHGPIHTCEVLLLPNGSGNTRDIFGQRESAALMEQCTRGNPFIRALVHGS